MPKPSCAIALAWICLTFLICKKCHANWTGSAIVKGFDGFEHRNFFLTHPISAFRLSPGSRLMSIYIYVNPD